MWIPTVDDWWTAIVLCISFAIAGAIFGPLLRNPK
jgi:hypothetical protein